MGDADTFLWSIIFGAIGAGYFIYGKNMGKLMPMLSGVLLCGFTWFVTDLVTVLLIGTVLTVLPFFFREA